jgi:hypothetical protein
LAKGEANVLQECEHNPPEEANRALPGLSSRCAKD